MRKIKWLAGLSIILSGLAFLTSCDKKNDDNNSNNNNPISIDTTKIIGKWIMYEIVEQFSQNNQIVKQDTFELEDIEKSGWDFSSNGQLTIYSYENGVSDTLKHFYKFVHNYSAIRVFEEDNINVLAVDSLAILELTDEKLSLIYITEIVEENNETYDGIGIANFKRN